MIKTIISFVLLSTIISCTATNKSIKRIAIDKMNAMSADENTIVIDVRTPGEVAEGYVKGTDKFIDYNGSNFADQIDALDKEKTYIVYCRSGNRSTKALHIMQEKGFKKLHELDGGIKGVSQPEYIVK
jgi:rhodanese-related sulfurtransferase